MICPAVNLDLMGGVGRPTSILARTGWGGPNWMGGQLPLRFRVLESIGRPWGQLPVICPKNDVGFHLIEDDRVEVLLVPDRNRHRATYHAADPTIWVMQKDDSPNEVNGEIADTRSIAPPATFDVDNERQVIANRRGGFAWFFRWRINDLEASELHLVSGIFHGLPDVRPATVLGHVLYGHIRAGEVARLPKRYLGPHWATSREGKRANDCPNDMKLQLAPPIKQSREI